MQVQPVWRATAVTMVSNTLFSLYFYLHVSADLLFTAGQHADDAKAHGLDGQSRTPVLR